MKRYFYVLFTILTIQALLLGEAADLSATTRTMLEKLSVKYIENATVTFKKNIAVGEITSPTDNKEMNGIAEAIRDLVIMQLGESTVFRVIDRREMGTISAEQKLQLSGMTSETDAVEIGSILNAHAVLQGRISDTGTATQLTLKLVDVETGEVFSELAAVSEAQLIATRETMLDMAFVQKMGIGLSLLSGGYNALGNNPSYIPFFDINQTGLVRIYGVEIKYRFSKNFMVGAGAASIYCNLKHYDFMTHNPALNPNETTFTGGEFNISGNGTSTFINVYGVINPLRQLNVFGCAGAEWIVIPFDGRFEPSNGNGFGVNEYGPTVHAEALVWNLSAGVEYFFTPRLALSLKAGYSFGEFSLPTGPGNGHLADLGEVTDVSLNSLYYQPSFSVYF